MRGCNRPQTANHPGLRSRSAPSRSLASKARSETNLTNKERA
nr:MAG TPA: hypothetical protein [Caudoviricetes sp.]